MKERLNIAILSGSSRKGSNTIKVAKALKHLLQQNEIVDQIYLIDMVDSDIPLVGRGEINKEFLTPFQRQLVYSFENSELILLCLPEYNWITNPEVINLFHQLGTKEFFSCFHLKVFATIGVSSGRGGRRPCIELHTLLNKIISFMGAISVVSPLILESHETDKEFDEEGNFLNRQNRGIYYEKFINFTDYTLKLSSKWHFGRNP
ncbi:MAG: NAD(P)H-dependent oxidoreductase [Leptospiraceae bacterium]|nr:NAD(P)H-dependent oxidoreductase [Leptospiraceae bacterium]MDW7975296.1 NAD(P)H-dependent oxidoreductase [Leptospiraceae bacterium]